MVVPVWKVLTSTNAPAPRIGVALTASTKPRQVGTTTLLSDMFYFVCVWYLRGLLYMFTLCSAHLFNVHISPLMQHRLSGVLWMIQHSAGDLAVPKSTKPNTAAVMQAFTWVAPLATVSVRVSCNYVLLHWSLGEILFYCCCFSKLSYRAVPSSRRPAQWHLSRANSTCYWGFTAQKIHEYLKTFTSLVINMVTNESNLWGQSATNKIILSRGHKLISIHLGHSFTALKM